MSQESRQVDLEGLHVTPWRKDPDGNEYRCHYNPKVPPPGDGYWVEYKPRELKLPLEPFKHFLVRVRGEVWSVWAVNAEKAAAPFWLEFSKTFPKREEVIVEEVTRYGKNNETDYLHVGNNKANMEDDKVNVARDIENT